MRALHGVLSGRDAAGFAAVAVPDELGHAERTARVAGGRLDPQLLERPLAEEAPVGYAVERHSPREAELVQSRLPVDGAGHSYHDLFTHRLN